MRFYTNILQKSALLIFCWHDYDRNRGSNSRNGSILVVDGSTLIIYGLHVTPLVQINS